MYDFCNDVKCVVKMEDIPDALIGNEIVIKGKSPLCLDALYLEGFYHYSQGSEDLFS